MEAVIVGEKIVRPEKYKMIFMRSASGKRERREELPNTKPGGVVKDARNDKEWCDSRADLGSGGRATKT